MSEDENGPVADEPVVLRPCPFCASEDVSISYDDWGFARWVTCNQCECDGPMLQIQPGTKEAATGWAVRSWNRRDGDRCASGCWIKKAVNRPLET